MFCSRCGRAVRSDANECPACGWYLRGDSQENYYRGNPYIHYPRYKEKNDMAIAAFILAFLLPPLGLIFSIIALLIADKRNGKGEGLSIAGLAISIVICIISFFI